MKFDDLLKLVGTQSWFDLASVVQLSEDTRQMGRVQLHRWCKAGKLIALRRGMYAFAKNYRREEINPAGLANALLQPSYLSLQWALGYYGLIPERAVEFTSVTTRQPKSFGNEFGAFRYRHLLTRLFFGYRQVILNQRKVLLAEPEKALLDLWYLEPGAWDADRIAQMRYQNSELIDRRVLTAYAARWNSPRIDAAVKGWIHYVDSESEGSVEV